MAGIFVCNHIENRGNIENDSMIDFKIVNVGTNSIRPLSDE